MRAYRFGFLFLIALVASAAAGDTLRAAEPVYRLAPPDAQLVSFVRFRQLSADTRIEADKLGAWLAMVNDFSVAGRFYSLLHNTTLRVANVDEACYFISDLHTDENVEISRDIPLLDGYCVRFDKPLPPEAPQAVLFRPKRVEHAGIAYYGRGADGPQAAFCLLDDRTLVVCAETVLRKLLAARKAETHEAAWFLSHLDAVWNDSHAAIVCRPTEATQRKMAASAPPLAAFTELRGQLRFGPRIQFRFEADAVEARPAVAFADQIRPEIGRAGKMLEELNPTEDSRRSEKPEQAAKMLETAKQLGGPIFRSIVVETRDATLVVRAEAADDDGRLKQLVDEMFAAATKWASEYLKAALDPPADETTARLRALLSSAAGMSVDDLAAVAVATTTPNAEQFDDQPLSLLWMIEKVTNDITDEQLKEFAVDHNAPIATPPPSRLIEQTLRSRWFGASSLLIPGDIRNVQAEFAGDTATGTFEFRRDPFRMSGNMEFSAQRDAQGWRITEFRLPVRKIKFALTEAGTWKMSTLK